MAGKKKAQVNKVANEANTKSSYGNTPKAAPTDNKQVASKTKARSST